MNGEYEGWKGRQGQIMQEPTAGEGDSVCGNSETEQVSNRDDDVLSGSGVGEHFQADGL